MTCSCVRCKRDTDEAFRDPSPGACNRCPSSGANERYKREGAICGAFGSIRLFWRAALHSDSVGLAAGGALAHVSDGGRSR